MEQPEFLKGGIKVLGKFNKVQVILCDQSIESVEHCGRVCGLRHNQDQGHGVLENHTRNFRLYSLNELRKEG